MAKRARTRLPKDIATQLRDSNLAELKAIFDTHKLDATAGYNKQTTLAFEECPDEFTRWLVAEGADLHAADKKGDTPLHSRAGWRNANVEILLNLGADPHRTNIAGDTPLHAAAASFKPHHVRILLMAGADVNAVNNDGTTPLGLALRRCANVQIALMAELTEILLTHGATQTRDMPELVTRIGTNFEFHRSGFRADKVDAVSAALDRLYQIYGATPVPRRVVHDGKAPIEIKPRGWQAQHEALWALLVPSRGPAQTVQGEVIRISGRISNELNGNGGINWDMDFARMADAFLEHVSGGQALPPDALAEAQRLVAAAKRRSGNADVLCELAVHWVRQNREPVALKPPPYDR